MSGPTLTAIRPALEGLAPSAVATSAADGTPNVVYISQLQYLDADHVGISNQFLSKTARNVQEQPLATALVIHPDTARSYRLWLRFVRSETEGEWFDAMQARLELIASLSPGAPHELRSVDVFAVESIEPQVSDMVGDPPAAPAPDPTSDATSDTEA